MGLRSSMFNYLYIYDLVTASVFRLFMDKA